jgi:cephalosporin-C deacetylase
MPLTFDYPLEQLKTYQGINPRPVDFDQYWDNALTEMRAIDPHLTLEPAEFQVPGVKCLDLYFTGVGGSRLHVKFLRPEKIQAPCPAVLMFHGYSSDSNDWSYKLNFVAQGFIVAALDTRGQGGYSEEKGGVIGNTLHGHIIRGLEDALSGRPEKLLYRQNFLDTAQLAKIILEMPEVDADRVCATGWSQGGGLTVACAALEPRIKRAAPVYPFLSDYKRVWEMDEAKDAYAELRDFFRHSDPQHSREGAVFTNLGYIDIQNLAPRIKAEVLWGTGLMDTVCPPSSQFAAYNKIQSQKKVALFPDFGHEELPGLNDQIFQFFLAK